MDAVIFILFLMLVVLVISMVIGAVMFCIDIWKWSKRPEVFSTAEEDLSKQQQVNKSEMASDFNVDS